MEKQNEKQTLMIVTVVALVAIGVMLMNVSAEFTGQATSALKVRSTAKAGVTSAAKACTDSDNGLDKFTIGTTKGPNPAGVMGTREDSCHSYQEVSEWYCATDGTAQYKPLDCPYGYTTESGSYIECVSGKCLTQDEALRYSKNCVDTDDGQQPYVKGSISGLAHSGVYIEGTDACRSSTEVSEWYCDENYEVQYTPMDCGEDICVDGVCGTLVIESVETESEETDSTTTLSACRDSDHGREHEVGGITTASSRSDQDYCLVVETEGYPPMYLYETYCYGSAVAHEIISCEETYGADYHCTTTDGLGACRSVLENDYGEITTGTPSSVPPTTTTGNPSSSSTSSPSASTGDSLNLG